MTSLTFPLKLGTRGSPLALAQANMVRTGLIAAHNWPESAVEIVTISTSGDQIQDRALTYIGGKALWTKELDEALFAGKIDFAVHSMKDVETIRPSEICIAAILERADVHDRLIGAESLEQLPQGARIGTSSPRRSAQFLRHRPDLQIILFRGNVATRLAKLEAGEADATLLAAAGLDRLGHPDIGYKVPADIMLPAPAQGAVGMECLTSRMDVRDILAKIDHGDTHICVLTERKLLEILGAGCSSPVAALAICEGDNIVLRAEILSVDGCEYESGRVIMKRGDMAPARQLALDLLERAGPELRALFVG